MKRILTIAFAFTLVATGAFAQGEDYGWSLSSSLSDPNVNVGVPAGGLGNVSLWLTCNTADGWASAELLLEANGLSILAATPVAPVLNVGVLPTLLLAVGGCPTVTGTVSDRVVDLLVLDAAGGSVCMTGVTVDCDPDFPVAWPSAVVGYASDGSGPCVVGECGSISVEPSSWGSVKSLYR